jgi:HK97 gp10 family phage protein
MPSVEIVGLNKLMARITELNQSLDPSAEAGLKEFAEVVRDMAKIFCPVGTPQSTGIPGYIGGSLRTSIRIQAYAKPKAHLHKIGVSAGGYITNPNTGRKVDYARWVEHGTSRMMSRPFMRPALDMCKKSILKLIKGGLKK